MAMWVAGAPYRLVAIDGTDVNAPTDVRDAAVQVTAGGRADLEVRMPADGSPVRVHLNGATGVVLGSSRPAAAPRPRAVLDPMHLHGHHILVLSRNGAAVTGSPWWADTLNVAPGERYEVAFRADNPGIWMDHCHNLPHAVQGLIVHLAYEGVTTPFRMGAASGNEPE